MAKGTATATKLRERSIYRFKVCVDNLVSTEVTAEEYRLDTDLLLHFTRGSDCVASFRTWASVERMDEVKESKNFGEMLDSLVQKGDPKDFPPDWGKLK